MSQHSITIIEPNGVQRTRPLTMRGLTIGRGTDNDLVISYNNVSRYHTQILFDNGHYYVADLNSANGTYLGNARLAPSESTLWTPGTPLSIGGVLIHLKQSQTQKLQQAPPPAAAAGTATARRDKEDTITGTVVGTPSQTAKNRGVSRILVVLLSLLILLCACVALGATAYYYLGLEWIN